MKRLAVFSLGCLGCLLCLPALSLDLVPKPLRPARDQIERAGKAVESEAKPVLKEVGYELEDATKSLIRQENQATVQMLLVDAVATPIDQDEDVAADGNDGGERDDDEKPLVEQYPKTAEALRSAWTVFRLFQDSRDLGNWSREEKRYQAGQWVNKLLGNTPDPYSDAAWHPPMKNPKDP